MNDDELPIPLNFTGWTHQGEMRLTIEELHALLKTGAVEVRSRYVRAEITKRLAEHYHGKFKTRLKD